MISNLLPPPSLGALDFFDFLTYWICPCHGHACWCWVHLRLHRRHHGRDHGGCGRWSSDGCGDYPLPASSSSSLSPAAPRRLRRELPRAELRDLRGAEPLRPLPVLRILLPRSRLRALRSSLRGPGREEPRKPEAEGRLVLAGGGAGAGAGGGAGAGAAGGGGAAGAGATEAQTGHSAASRRRSYPYPPRTSICGLSLPDSAKPLICWTVKALFAAAGVNVPFSLSHG